MVITFGNSVLGLLVIVLVLSEVDGLMLKPSKNGEQGFVSCLLPCVPNAAVTPLELAKKMSPDELRDLVSHEIEEIERDVGRNREKRLQKRYYLKIIDRIKTVRAKVTIYSNFPKLIGYNAYFVEEIKRLDNLMLTAEIAKWIYPQDLRSLVRSKIDEIESDLVQNELKNMDYFSIFNRIKTLRDKVAVYKNFGSYNPNFNIDYIAYFTKDKKRLERLMLTPEIANCMNPEELRSLVSIEIGDIYREIKLNKLEESDRLSISNRIDTHRKKISACSSLPNLKRLCMEEIGILDNLEVQMANMMNPEELITFVSREIDKIEKIASVKEIDYYSIMKRIRTYRNKVDNSRNEGFELCKKLDSLKKELHLKIENAATSEDA